MTGLPSDRMLNHVVTVKHKLADCDAFGPAVSYRAALRPVSDATKVALGFEVTQARMKVYFREDVAIRKGDRIDYTDNRGDARYVIAEGPVVDEKGMGMLYTAEGRDVAAD